MDSRNGQDSLGGGRFFCGLLTGAALGAAAAMLTVPKPGSDMRQDLAGRLGDLGQTAKDRWARVADVAATAAHQGREAYDQARDAVQEGTDTIRTASAGRARRS